MNRTIKSRLPAALVLLALLAFGGNAAGQIEYYSFECPLTSIREGDGDTLFACTIMRHDDSSATPGGGTRQGSKITQYVTGGGGPPFTSAALPDDDFETTAQGGYREGSYCGATGQDVGSCDLNSIIIKGDNLIERDEYITVSFVCEGILCRSSSRFRRATLIGTTRFVIRIVDDDRTAEDDNAVFTIAGPARLAEGDTGTFTIRYDTGSLLGPTNVAWIASHTTHGATEDADLRATRGNVTFALGETSKTFELGISVDTLSEDEEPFTLILNPLYGSSAAAHTVTIAANAGSTREPCPDDQQ